MTWNRTVVEIMAAPAGLFRDGMPMGDLVAHLAPLGYYGEGEFQCLTEQRLRKIAAGHLAY